MSEEKIRELFRRLQALDTRQLVIELRQLQKEQPELFGRLLEYMRERGWTDQSRPDSTG
jgi:uncharacterized protein YecE (DUF72 family)